MTLTLSSNVRDLRRALLVDDCNMSDARTFSEEQALPIDAIEVSEQQDENDELCWRSGRGSFLEFLSFVCRPSFSQSLREDMEIVAFLVGLGEIMMFL